MKLVLFIVDDNLMMREFLKNYFGKDYEVQTFNSGLELFNALDITRLPNLIMLDYELQDNNGVELLQELKTSGFLREIPVMFLSGKQKSEIRISCLKEGAEDFVLKPFNPEELSLRVQKLIAS
jgi:DNA-binding response OmpR family regulator